MATKTTQAATVDEYIKNFPPAVQTKLRQIRKIIKAAAPKAEELISYGIAGYKYHGMLIYFAGFTNHVSVYPAPRSADEFKKELAAYKGGKGTVQFPLDKPVPAELVKRIVKYRVKLNEEKLALKKSSKKKFKETKTNPSCKKLTSPQTSKRLKKKYGNASGTFTTIKPGPVPLPKALLYRQTTGKKVLKYFSMMVIIPAW